MTQTGATNTTICLRIGPPKIDGDILPLLVLDAYKLHANLPLALEVAMLTARTSLTNKSAHMMTLQYKRYSTFPALISEADGMRPRRSSSAAFMTSGSLCMLHHHPSQAQSIRRIMQFLTLQRLQRCRPSCSMQ